MLVLTRKDGEVVMIGDAVVVILRDAHGRVRLGIDCDKSILVSRGELLTPEKQAEVAERIGRPAVPGRSGAAA